MKPPRLERLYAIVAIAALVAAPIDLAHLGAPRISQLRQAIALRDLPVHLVLGVAGVIGWLAWIWIITTLAAETADTVHHKSRPRRRTLQAAVAPIVALLLTVAPRAAQHTPIAAAASTAQPASPPPPPVAPTATRNDTPTTPLQYVVRPGDNLWDLALDFYGDGYAFERIWHASNLDDPRHLHPGQTLTVPAAGLLPAARPNLIDPTHHTHTAQPAAAEQVTVAAGQTLWNIAQEDLGNGEDWPAIWAANTGRPEPGGTLDDPNLIRPGWQLTIPHPTTTPANPATIGSQPRSIQKPTAQPNNHRAEPTKPTPTPPSPPNHQTPASVGDDHPNRPPPADETPAPTTPATDRYLHRPPADVPGWDLPRLAGEGAVLLGASAVGIWGLRRRLRQHAHLPPGQRLTPTPAREHPATAAVNVEATRAAPDTNILHTALGHLENIVGGWPPAERPWLVGLRTQPGHAELVFDSPTLPAPTPFAQTSPTTWTLTNPPAAPSPPGPGLVVCVGWQGPAWVWIDLQAPARISLTGPHATRLARLWAAQAAGAEICDGARVTTVDLDPLPGTRPQIAPAVEEDLATWAAEPDRNRGVAWWGDPDRPPAELIVAAHPLAVPDRLGRGVAVIAIDDPHAAWTIDTTHDTTHIGDLGDIHLISPPPQLQQAVEAELARAEAATTQPAPPPPATTPPGDIRIRILGPTTIETVGEPIRHRAVTQLAAYLAAHPHGARRQQWATALWPETRVEDKTLRNRIFDLRRALGGTQAIRTQNGVDQLNVATDWTLFAHHLTHGDPQAALELVRGEPLADLDTEWPYAEDAPASQIIVAITTTALDYGHNQLHTNPAQAEWAARQGLTASPYDHQLWTLRLQALVNQGRRTEARNLLQHLQATQPDLADEKLAATTR